MHNAKYVLGNYLAQQAIELAKQQSDVLLLQLQGVLSKRYYGQQVFESFAEKRPAWAKQKAGCLMLSCNT
jgi:uncharacterized protein YdiU (UPF0061 family)